MKLGRGGKHLGLDAIPDGNGHGHQILRHLLDRVVRGVGEEGLGHGAEDLVDRGRGGEGHVHDVEVALGPIRNVILAGPGMKHRAKK